MLVGVTQAAKKLNVSHSTISRYLKRYPELIVEPGARPKVELETLKQHRQENLTVEETANPQPQLPAVATPDPGKAASDQEAVDIRKRSSQAKANLDELKQRKLALELAALEGDLIAIEEVEAAFADAGALLQNRLEARRRDLADRFVSLTDIKDIEAALKDADRELLEAFSQRLGELAEAAETGANGAGSERGPDVDEAA